MKIAVISDLHFGRNDNAVLPERQGSLSDVFLLRAIRRINRFIRPDLTCILGDLIDQPADPEATALYDELRRLTEQLESPVVIIPGNHDRQAELFYRHFPVPPPFLDLAGFRVMSFIDADRPGYNASRSTADTARMRELSAGFAGPKIMLQHVPVFPNDAVACPFNHLDSPELVAAMAESGIVMAIAGHFHDGFNLLETGRNFIAAPALCERPFRFLEIDLDESGRAAVTEHRLRLPDELHLTDCHVHTPLAYCSENLSPERTFAMGAAVGLDGIVFSEHAGQLYLGNEDYWRSTYYPSGLAGCRLQLRTAEYFQLLEDCAGMPFRSGFELEPDAAGRPVIRPEDLARVKIRLGAIHYLGKTGNLAEMKKEFLFLTGRLIESGIHILAHPFRIFHRAKLPPPAELYPAVAAMLKKHGVAAEINYHTNEPEPEFFRLCIEQGVKIVFGSDSHNLCEIGDFYPHLQLIDRIGCRDRLPSLFPALPE